MTMTLVGVATAVLAVSGCGDGIDVVDSTGAATATAAAATGSGSATSGSPTTIASPARTSATASATTAAGVRVRNLDGKYFDGLQRVLTVSRSCSAPDALEVRFKAGVLQRQQVRLLMIDRSGRLLRSGARWLSLTDPAPGGDGGVPSYGVRATWTLRQVAGAPMASGESSGWRVVLVTADSTRALARPVAAVVPSCGDRVWDAPSPTLEVTDVRRDCTAAAPADEYFSARVRAAGLVYGQHYAIDGGASGNDLNTVPSRWAESYDGDMAFVPGIDRRPSPNGLAAAFPRTAFTVSVRLGPGDVVRAALRAGPLQWFEARDETSEVVQVAVPGC